MTRLRNEDHTSHEDDDGVLAVDSRGNELLAVEFGPPRGAADPRAPLTGALVVVTGPAGTLLVHDVWRDEWELAGGGIEARETSTEAAKREVCEESGQRVCGLRLVGRARFRLSNGNIEQADLFVAVVDCVLPFTPNRETDAVRWWDGRSPITGLNIIDRELIDRVHRHVTTDDETQD